MIRPATSADAAAICALWNWMIRDTDATFTTQEKTVEAVAEIIDLRQRAFFVCEQGAALSGFVTFGPFRAGPGYAATVEHSVIVDPEYVRCGVGRALLTHAVDVARSQDLHVMVAAISGSNRPAVALHHAVGFEEVGHMPQVGRKFGRWLDLVLMQKILTLQP